MYSADFWPSPGPDERGIPGAAVEAALSDGVPQVQVAFVISVESMLSHCLGSAV